MLGTYARRRGNTLRFTPMFPLDPGRQYRVALRTGAANGHDDDASAPLIATVGLPRSEAVSSTVVSHIFPSSEVVPENQLRLYIHFSAPMGRSAGLEYITLIDASGAEVVDPFLPLDAEFWNDDRTRYTVFFDPGRQKRGILPNQQMGRSLEPGKRYTLVISREWRDGNGLPLEGGVPPRIPRRSGGRTAARRERMASGASSGGHARCARRSTFDEPLDHGLLLRALGVTGGDGKFLDGDVKIDAGESRWSFTPRAAWKAGVYQLTALAMLEDLAGNRIGRAFEVDTFNRVDARPSRNARRCRSPFAIEGAGLQAWRSSAHIRFTTVEKRQKRPPCRRDALRVAFLVRGSGRFRPAAVGRAALESGTRGRGRWRPPARRLNTGREVFAGSLEFAQREHDQRRVEDLGADGRVRAPAAVSALSTLERADGARCVASALPASRSSPSASTTAAASMTLSTLVARSHRSACASGAPVSFIAAAANSTRFAAHVASVVP